MAALYTSHAHTTLVILNRNNEDKLLIFQTAGVETLGNYPGGWLGEGMELGCHAPGLQGLSTPAGNRSSAASGPVGAREKTPFPAYSYVHKQNKCARSNP